MEFADLILAPNINSATLYAPPNVKIEGPLCVSGHHLIVSTNSDPKVDIMLLYTNIDHIERKQASNVQLGGSLIIKCKDFRILQLDLHNLEDFSNVAASLDKLINVDILTKLYPFFYRPLYGIIEDGWTAFRPETEFNKVVTANGDDWRISYVNQDFKVCPTYPSAVVVPKCIDDETLITVAGFRDGGRFPVLSYRYDSGIVLMRSSQPLTGPNGRRCKEDERLLNSLLGPGKRGYIVDTRTAASAQNARAKGGGYETEVAYPQWRRVHRPLEKISNLLDGLTKMMEGCNDKNSSMDRWLSRLDSSDWLGSVKGALNCACLLAQCLDHDKSSVLVHGGESMDHTPLVASLTQLLLNPDTRTIRGLEALVEREWIQAGYPFPLRHQRSCYSASNLRGKVHAPTFLLFLDCISQVHNQFPCSFEFTLDFLIVLFEHSYSSEFGTFLGTCEAERDRLKLSEKTVSLWSYLNRPDVLPQYLNVLYEPNNNIIWPSVAPMSLNLWSELYLRWTIDTSSHKAATRAIAALKARDTELRQKAGRLRRQLADLERDAVAAGLLPVASPTRA